jgi:4,5-DOPA dioxygenase extradiol
VSETIAKDHFFICGGRKFMGLALAFWGFLMNELTQAASLNELVLNKSPRMPVLFLGHGSPMNAIEDNEYRRSWQALGTQFGPKLPGPS